MAQESLSLDDLSVVRAIAEAGSLAGAARAMGLDPSNVFRRLGAIEARLGATLFRRSRRGYEPTEAGELVRQSAERMLAESDGLLRQLAGHDRRMQGVLRITVPDTLVQPVLGLCAQFREAHPSIDLELVISNAFLTLQRRDADIALRPARKAPDGMSVRHLARVGSAIYGPRKTKRADTPSFIGYGDALSHLDAARWIHRNISVDQVSLTVDTLPAARSASEDGWGRTVLPCYFGDSSPGLKRIGDVLSDVDTELWCVTHPDLRRSSRVRAFRDMATAWATAHRAMLEGTS